MQQFTDQEITRYHRQLILPEFGPAGQQKLQHGKILVIGAGGLGCPILQYLAAAGVGTIGIVDHDTVSGSNLHRQILYTLEDIGKSKAVVAKQKLSALNPLIHIEAYPYKLDSSNAMQLFQSYDVIVDGSDNFPTRYLVNDACILAAKPLVYGAIYKFEGQVSVFNVALDDGVRSPNYRDLFPIPPNPDTVPSCNEIGVIGVLPGIIGCIQANEAIKLLAGIGENLESRLFIFDTLSFHSRIVKYKKTNQEPIRKLIDYDLFCAGSAKTENNTISAEELAAKLEANSNLLLVDVRQSFEYEQGHLQAMNIPLHELKHRLAEFPTDRELVLYCKSGARSAKALHLLKEAGLINVSHLKGGIKAYIQRYNLDINIL